MRILTDEEIRALLEKWKEPTWKEHLATCALDIIVILSAGALITSFLWFFYD